MASTSVEDFVGNGSLKELLPKLFEDGWDDVLTLKVMNSEDMVEINMTREQKDALEIRSYLHDHSLIQYGDKLEASGKCLAELLNLNTAELSFQFGMKRGHIARFMNRTSECSEKPSPASITLPERQRQVPTTNNNNYKGELMSASSRKLQSVRRVPLKSNSIANSVTNQHSLSDFKLKDDHIYKGIVAAMPDEPRGCGCVMPPSVAKNVAPYSTIQNISVQKLTPEYKNGMEHLIKTKTPPMKASELWCHKPAVLLCIRRPGCIMCRAEAHKINLNKPIFDALGIQLYAVIQEQIESEVKDFWPRYWSGAVILDKNREFFKALGGGNLMKENFISGFLLNPRAIANYKRAKAMGLEHNYRGEGDIKGGLFIIGKGKTGIAYQFIERNFGDWAPLAEVIGICTQLQNRQQNLGESCKSSQEYSAA
ncbi:hypothetical protein DCAR_0934936 [Daucus carota subsp. sativus]|uniref:Peroxiredoxin-like 2A n=1 Tax=Daucus carota subsp. sativus TaxID=79200 RepID=A0AAF1BET1_DAUCS|nr:hypothetical protein DCAR_0934936 [Daucus carota subsp. sativus]